MNISITDRWALTYLRGPLTRLMRSNTPPRDHDNTLLYFGTDVDDFRDILRMHNVMANYVFLVDDRGTVRFASSGEATPDELDSVIEFTKELCAETKGRKTRKK